MKRGLAIPLSILIGLADIAAIVSTTAYGQVLADSGASRAPWWLGPSWLISFFPARFVLAFPPFRHPLGLGGDSDTVVWGGLALANGALWGVAAYSVFRALGRRAVSHAAS